MLRAGLAAVTPAPDGAGYVLVFRDPTAGGVSVDGITHATGAGVVTVTLPPDLAARLAADLTAAVLGGTNAVVP